MFKSVAMPLHGQRTCFQVALLYFSALCCNGKLTVLISSDGPALEKAPISFKAELIGADNLTKYEFLWEDDSSNKKFPPDDHGDLSSNLTTTYPKKGEYTMTVTVRKSTFVPGMYKIVAKNSTSFHITNTINGRLTVVSERPQPLEPSEDIIVATNELVNVTFQLHDPGKFLENATFMYPWKLDREMIEIRMPYVELNLTEARTYAITLMVVVYGFDFHYVGNFEMSLNARDPIRKIEVIGETSLKLGDLLEVEITCDGSPPWSYCFFITTGEVNSTSAKCPNDVIVTTQCDIPIFHYFPSPGLYKLVFITDNDITHQVKVTDVAMSENTPEPQMLIVIVPLVCCCLALVIIIMGVALFVQSRRHYQVEVADFDFLESENLEYQTFRQRLKGSMQEAVQGWRRDRRNFSDRCGVESADDQPDLIQ